MRGDAPDPAACPEPGAGGGSSPPLLLVGAEAERLAARMAVSGYRPHTLADLPETGSAAPAALILSPDQEALISELRRRFAGVPLLLGISGDTLEGRVRCLASGADDFWITSLGASDLLTRIRLHRGLRAASAPTTAIGTVPTGEPPAAAPRPQQLPELPRVGDLRLNSSTRQVWRGRRSLQLTAREYDLLLLLLERSGRVVSRDEILAAIWPQERPAASNVIEVYIRYLRQKLEEQGERRLIHTVRGQGYCLSEGLPARGGEAP